MYGGLSPASGESMITGSPTSGVFGGSPVAMNGLPNTGSPPKTPFLPPYLLGLGQHQSTPSSAAENRRKSQLQHHGGGGYLSPPASQRHVTWSPDLVERIPIAATASPITGAAVANVNRYGGPPVRTLDMITADNSSHYHHHLSSTIPLDRLDDASCLMMNGSAAATAVPASQIDSFYTQGEDLNPTSDLDNSWVTVFGFPADSANYILKEFSAYGPIVEHEFANKGNWVHIRYQSPMHARRALSKNGHLYAQNTIRIGVTPCIDKDVMQRYQQRRKNMLSRQDDGDEDALDDVGGGRKRLKTSSSSASTSRLIPPTSDISAASPRSNAVGGATANNRSLFSRQFDTSTPVRSGGGPLPALLRFDNNNTSAVASPSSSAAAADTPTTTRRTAQLVGNMRSLAAAYERPPQRQQHNHFATANGNGNGGEETITNGTTTTNGNVLSKAWNYMFSS